VGFCGFASARFLFAEWFGQLTAAALITLAWFLGSPAATREPWFRENGVNLEARRGDPRIWLVAHIDSKSQPIPSLVRSVGVVLLVLGGSLQFILPWSLDRYLYDVAMIGSLILVAASVGSQSDGAADNASGVAAVLEAATLVGPAKSLGILITDAEELALAGARAWVTAQPGKGIAINCDTVDDDGELVVLVYGTKGDLVASARKSVRRVLTPTHLPGVLTDSNAFRSAGWQSVTLARGTIRTLNRIHTRRDSLHNLRGTGIPDAARVLARLVEELA
jgi:hypothetical protein